MWGDVFFFELIQRLCRHSPRFFLSYIMLLLISPFLLLAAILVIKLSFVDLAFDSPILNIYDPLEANLIIVLF